MHCQPHKLLLGNIAAKKNQSIKSHVTFMNMNNKTSRQDRTETLAFRVETSRNDLGLTQAELAERAGISRGHVSKIESGQVTNIRRITVEALAKALEVPASYLLAFVEVSDEGEDDVDKFMRQSPLVKQLMDLFIQLPLRDQKLLVSIARTMSDVEKPHIIGGTEEDET